MGFIPPDTNNPVAVLTKAGRNLLARSIVPRNKLTGNEPDLPLVNFKLAGFVFGDGGYLLDNPLIVTPILDETQQAEATITILDNRFDINDAIVINGVSFKAGIEIVASGAAISGTNNGGPTSGFDNFIENNSGGGGGTLTVSSNTLPINAFVGQRLRIIGGTLAGLEEEIVSNSSNEFEIGILDPKAPLPTGSPLGKSWQQAGSGGLLPDFTTQWQVITASPGAGTWVPGLTEEETANNIADAINSSSHPLVKNVVRAEVINSVITLKALSIGTLGNFNTVSEIDEGGLGFNNFSIFSENGSFSGGLNTTLQNAVFPATAPVDVNNFLDFEFPTPQTVSLVCRAGQSEANFGLGEIGIYVDIIDSANPLEIGERVLYAIGHFPIVAKNSKSVFLTRVITQY